MASLEFAVEKGRRLLQQIRVSTALAGNPGCAAHALLKQMELEELIKEHGQPLVDALANKDAGGGTPGMIEDDNE